VSSKQSYCENAWTMIAWPSQIYRAHSKIVNIFFGSSSWILSSIWPQWSGEQQFGSQTRLSYRDDTSVAVVAISASIVLVAAHNSIKAAARPASKHQRRSPAHIMSYSDAESIFCERNPVDGKRGPIQMTCNGSHSSMTQHLREERFRPTTFDCKVSSIYRIPF